MSLIQKIRLVLDEQSKRKATADAKAAGREMGNNIATGVQESAAQIRARVRAAITSGADVTLAGRGAPAKAAADVAVGLDKVAKTAPQAGGALARLREPLTALAAQSAGASGTMGTLVSTLGMLAIGGGLTGGILAGIAAIGFAWDRVTAKTRAAKEATQEALARLAGIRAAEIPEQGVANAIGAGQAEEQRLAREIARLERDIAVNGTESVRGNQAGTVTRTTRPQVAELARLRGELATTRQNVAAGQRELQRILADQRGARPGGGGGGGAGRGASAGFDRGAFQRLRSDVFYTDRAQAASAAAGIGGGFAGTNAGADLAASLFGAPSADSLAATVRSGLEDLDQQLAGIVTATPLQEMQQAMRDGFATAFVDGIGAGFAGLFESGSLDDGFKALTGALLTGIGGAMMEFGKASLLASALMATIKKALASLNPAGAIAASLALIAGGAALMALGNAANRSYGGMGGGGYGGYVGGGASNGGPGLAMNERGGVINIWVDQFSTSNPLQVEVLGKMVNAADSRGIVRLNPGPRTGRRS